MAAVVAAAPEDAQAAPLQNLLMRIVRWFSFLADLLKTVC